MAPGFICRSIRFFKWGCCWPFPWWESSLWKGWDGKDWKVLKTRAKSTAMSRLLSLFCVSLFLGSAAMAQVQGEHIVMTGTPSLMEWEKYKVQPHDNWWMNFVRASRLRIDQLRQQYGPSARITWLVYQRGYERRQKQEHESLFSIIQSVRDKYGLDDAKKDRKSTRLNSSHVAISYAV